MQPIILEYGFYSGGEYGDVMLEKMNTMFKVEMQVGGCVSGTQMQGAKD